MRDKKTVYLHIGWEKTGTSAIQSFLGRNQSWLRHQGFHYPIMGSVPQHLVMYEALSSSRPRRVAKMVDNIRELVRSSKEPSVIFSHERFHDCNPAIFRDIFKDENVCIIAYLRRYDYSIISFFSTIIRWGLFSINPRNTLIRRFKAEHLRYFDYFWPLSNFACVFGKESLILRKYGKEDLIGGNSVQDFMCLLGIKDLDGSLWPEARSNLSLDMDQLQFIFELAPQFRAVGSEEARQATRRICDILLAQTGEDVSKSVWEFTSTRIKQRILDYYAPNTEMLSEAFFDGNNVFPPLEDESQEYEGLSNEKREQFLTVLHEDEGLSESVKRRLPTSSKASLFSPEISHVGLDRKA